MDNQNKKWVAELMWLAMGGIIALLAILPIYNAGISFEWLAFNLVFVFAAFTLVRIIFSFEHHPLGGSKLFKAILICLVPIFIFPIIEGIHSFTEFHDREGLQSLMSHLSPDRQTFYTSYIKTEYLLAGMTCFLGVFALIIKMIRSLWRQVKYGLV
jgi:hypothetical protein